MSTHENNAGQSWFKTATLCAAFFCAAAVTPVADAQPVAAKTHSAVDAKGEHRKLLEQQIELSSALGILGGSSQETIDKYRTDAKAQLDEKATGNAGDMQRASSGNRALEKQLKQMVKTLRVSPA